jgi:hypothetical protein
MDGRMEDWKDGHPVFHPSILPFLLSSFSFRKDEMRPNRIGVWIVNARKTTLAYNFI